MSSASASRDWDAATYDRVSDPQLAWERLERAGFIDVQTWLEPKSVTPEDPRALIRQEGSARSHGLPIRWH